MNNVLPPDDDTKTVKFLLKENLARYKLNNKGKKLKTLIIDDNQYRYNPTKPISKKLKSKLEKKRQTNEYRVSRDITPIYLPFMVSVVEQSLYSRCDAAHSSLTFGPNLAISVRSVP